jgi:hypothetical protein
MCLRVLSGDEVDSQHRDTQSQTINIALSAAPAEVQPMEKNWYDPLPEQIREAVFAEMRRMQNGQTAITP